MPKHESYADIHHFDSKCNAVDEDGDPMLGWYFQIMQSAEIALSDLMGPYHKRAECETAAMTEWEGMAA